MEIGLRLGAERFCDYFEQFGLMEKTGVDLPGEASTIMHRLEDIGEGELATMTFGTDGRHSQFLDQWRKEGNASFWGRSAGQ